MNPSDRPNWLPPYADKEPPPMPPDWGGYLNKDPETPSLAFRLVLAVSSILVLGSSILLAIRFLGGAPE